MAKWNYNGDVNLKCGGYFWRVNNPTDDFAEIVDVVPESDMGGPDNVFLIEIGSIYFNPETRADALKCCGYADDETLTTGMLVDAYKAYSGVEGDYSMTIQIGKDDPFRSRDSHFPDVYVIRGNWKLKNYVKREFL